MLVSKNRKLLIMAVFGTLLCSTESFAGESESMARAGVDFNVPAEPIAQPSGWRSYIPNWRPWARSASYYGGSALAGAVPQFAVMNDPYGHYSFINNPYGRAAIGSPLLQTGVDAAFSPTADEQRKAAWVRTFAPSLLLGALIYSDIMKGSNPDPYMLGAKLGGISLLSGGISSAIASQEAQAAQKNALIEEFLANNRFQTPSYSEQLSDLKAYESAQNPKVPDIGTRQPFFMQEHNIEDNSKLQDFFGTNPNTNKQPAKPIRDLYSQYFS